MIVTSSNPQQERKDAERAAKNDQKLAAKPIEEQAAILARQWQVTPHFALRFLQLEQAVADLTK